MRLAWSSGPIAGNCECTRSAGPFSENREEFPDIVHAMSLVVTKEEVDVAVDVLEECIKLTAV
jgi:hypothetical protein